MASDPQSSPFIKHLASSDKKTRDNALDSLRTFLSGRSQIEKLDLLKLWKGLFYCMWMQDKPANQQRLARDLASLVDALQSPVVLPFLECFWKTMAREWGQIDALRMDKYLYLIRLYLHASLRFLARNDWSNTDAVTQYVDILESIPLNSTDPKIPNGLRYHMFDIYLDELEKVGGDNMDAMPVEQLLEPIRMVHAESKVKSVRVAAKEVLDDDRLKVWRGVIVGDGKDDEMGDEDGEWGGIED
ncbi:nucleolar [Clohesyomyces aquaticus]|uniref:Nucleolar n=1 Tax=Clohesyomyces aquaticus TaxID=1231657 RepID=A0A1Y1Z8Q7_9PLEO|nr:nucleolar [Clohesyomyces aquaticus]